MPRLIHICIIFFVVSAQAQSEFNIDLNDDNIGLSLGNNVGVLRDANDTYEHIESILDLPSNVFEKRHQEILDFNFTSDRYWLQFSITNTSNYDHFILETGRPVTNEVVVYEYTDGELTNTFFSGDDFDYYDKKIKHTKNVFPIKIEKGNSKTFYIQLKSDGELLFAPIIFHERMAFFAQDFKNQFKNGFYYGLIALVVVIYFFFFIFLKDKTFLFYIIYAFSQGVLQFSLDGYGHHHFFPSGGYFANHILLLFAGLTVVFLLTYVNNFLQLKERSLRLWNIFIVCRWMMIGIIVLSLIPGTPYELSYPIINGASLVSVLLAAFAIIRIRLKGEYVDPFFALAFLILIIGGVIFILGNLSVVGDKMISLGALKISSALEFVVLSISMSNKYGKLQRDKEEAQKAALQNLKEKNVLMDQSNALLEIQVKERTSEIENQKAELSKSKEEIVSSIKYAQRIQQAILPAQEKVDALVKNAFVFYRPKDVVSGDFYFIEETETTNDNPMPYIIFAAVDCTGHGVPGAFMSIVGNNVLKQSLKNVEVNSPGEALSFLNRGILKTLQRSVEGIAIRDGMDIAMCAIRKDHSKLVFSGAKNPLYIIRRVKHITNNSLTEEMELMAKNDKFGIIQIRGDKFPIGNGHENEMHEFQNHEVTLFEGDEIIVFTDGFADQFGGPRRKKYNYRRFREFLLSLAEKSIVEQEVLIAAEFEEWQGENEQIDDVLVMGLKIEKT